MTPTQRMTQESVMALAATPHGLARAMGILGNAVKGTSDE